MEKLELLDIFIIKVKKLYKLEKFYVYLIKVLRKGGYTSFVYRRYKEFDNLLNSIIVEYPQYFLDNKSAPILPAKIFLGRSSIKEVAVSRKPHMQEFLKNILSMRDVAHSETFQQFLTPTKEDIELLMASTKLQSEVSKSQDFDISVPQPLEEAQVIDSHKASSKDQVSVTTGQTVQVMERTNVGYWLIRDPVSQNRGWVPASCFRARTAAIDAKDPAAGSLLVCTGQSPKNADFILYMGQVVRLVSTRGDGWWMVEACGCKGRTAANRLGLVKETDLQLTPPRPPPRPAPPRTTLTTLQLPASSSAVSRSTPDLRVPPRPPPRK